MFKSIILVILAVCSTLLSGCAAPQNNADLIHLRQLKEQAFSGNPESQYRLGVHYTTSSQWSWDKVRGYNWFLDAAEAGHVAAQYMVGMCKLLGQGTKEDSKGAMVWLIRAAEQGHSRSQYQLGQAYLNGNGTAKDSLWGRYWLEQAARTKHPEAQFLLAALLSEGISAPPNRPEAWMWLKRAELNGQRNAGIALRKLAAELTDREKKIGEQLADRFEDVGSDGLHTQPKIRYVQAALNRRGFSAGSEDGLYGPSTRMAVNEYLQQQELPRGSSIDVLIGYLRGRVQGNR